MKRNIIEIDEELCNGCGICVSACHEGALQMINGKAKLITDSYCDGLGACLPECPTGAITIIERDAAEFDEAAVNAKKELEKSRAHSFETFQKATEKTYEPCACPGSMAKSLTKSMLSKSDNAVSSEPKPVQHVEKASISELRQWPVQIKLVPVKAPYFQNAHLLVAADCTAFAYGNIHNDYMKDKITIIGCPKLDEGDYSDKLAAILANNDIESVHVLRMEVPCCGGITHAVKQALQKSGKMIPWHVTTITANGEVLPGIF